MKVPSAHPRPEQLAAFGLGRLDPASSAEIERHVAACATCCQALRTVPDDSLVGRLRTPNSSLDSPDFRVPAPSDVPPELTDHPRYRIVRVLGAGGMGVVYQAEHRLMERPVALKVLARSLTSNPAAVERFRLEVKAAARLSHPNIVTAHDADCAGDVHFLVMELVEGISLARLVEKRGALPVGHACHYARQAALGLQHAFEQGMVHRDVKPQNLMLTRKGQVKILDFGLARLAREAGQGDTVPGGCTPAPAGLTAAGAVLGTPDYIAPEQAGDSRSADVRADVYSLGCTLYFLLAGHVPFPHGSTTQKVLAHAAGTPQALGEVRDDVPPELLGVLERMMAKDPARRYQTPAEVALALAPFARAAAAPAAERPAANHAERPAADAPAAPADGGGTRTRPPRRRPGTGRGRPLVFGIIGAGVVVAAVLAALFLPGRGSRTPRVLVVLPARDFSYPDYQPVRRTLEQGGARVAVASPAALARPDLDGKGKDVPADVLLEEARPGDYDAVVFVGGKGLKDLMEDTPAGRAAHRLVEDMWAANKHVAALGMGPVALTGTSALRGRRVACFRGPPVPWKVEKEGGGRVVDEPVVVDGRLITGRDPAAAEEFARTLLRALRNQR